MTLSNALPIQFWLSGEETFNEKTVCGITPQCWCQPWNCEDELSLQFQSDEDNEYSLNILNTNEDILETIPFEQTQRYSDDYVSSFPLTAFTNQVVSGPAWTPGANPSIVTTDIALGSDYLTESVTGIPAGVYLLNIGLNYSGASVTLSMSFLKDGLTVGSATFLFDGLDIDQPITLTDAPDTIRFSVGSSTNSTRTTTIYNYSLVRNGYYYSVAFTPSDYDLCDDQVRLHIWNEDTSAQEAISDCVLLKESHSCTVGIDYYNNSDFNNIIYENTSPQTAFKLLIPAIFFEEDNPAEQEDHELSSNQIIRLYNKLELKKKLDIGFMPAYMHQKLQLVLMHDNVTIDSRQWIRRDAYEKKEGHRMYPLRRASVWLHDKDFIKENQL